MYKRMRVPVDGSGSFRTVRARLRRGRDACPSAGCKSAREGTCGPRVSSVTTTGVSA